MRFVYAKAILDDVEFTGCCGGCGESRNEVKKSERSGRRDGDLHRL